MKSEEVCGLQNEVNEKDEGLMSVVVKGRSAQCNNEGIVDSKLAMGE